MLRLEFDLLITPKYQGCGGCQRHVLEHLEACFVVAIDVLSCTSLRKYLQTNTSDIINTNYLSIMWCQHSTIESCFKRQRKQPCCLLLLVFSTWSILVQNTEVHHSNYKCSCHPQQNYKICQNTTKRKLRDKGKNRILTKQLTKIYTMCYKTSGVENLGEDKTSTSKNPIFQKVNSTPSQNLHKRNDREHFCIFRVHNFVVKF